MILEPPRWPGGPPICPVENLPAFPTQDALKKFKAENSPSVEIIKIGKCAACEHWHAKT